MKVKQLTLGAMASNCYIIKKNDQVLIVDPGDMPEEIINNIEESDNVLAVLLTHGHFDHIGALDCVVDKFKCPVYISKDEKTLINNPAQSFYDKPLKADLTYVDTNFSVGIFDIILHKTPGHTEGSVLFEIENYLFTGDTLFDNSIGRVDFPSGNAKKMIESLHYIKTLNPDFIICPGHMEMSTLKSQLNFNPYLNR